MKGGGLLEYLLPKIDWEWGGGGGHLFMDSIVTPLRRKVVFNRFLTNNHFSYEYEISPKVNSQFLLSNYCFRFLF